MGGMLDFGLPRGALTERRFISPGRRWVWAACGAALLASPATGVWADSPASSLDSLEARVAALETENARLQAQVRLLPAPDSPLPLSDTAATPVTHPTTWAEGGESAADIRAEIEKYLSEKEAEEKAAAEAEKEAEAAEGYEVGSDLGMTAKWNHGLELQTKNKDFRVHVGGRTQFDSSWYAVDDSVQSNINLPYQDGVDFRRGRLRVDGTFYETIDWAAEYDFINAVRLRNAAGTGTFDAGVPAITDLWLTFRELPRVGNLRVGSHKEAIGFEHLVSSRFLPFLERSYNQDAFYGGAFNGFTPGVSIFDTYDDEWGTWNIGVFKPTDNVFSYNAHDDDYAVTGRLTRLLIYEGEGHQLLHVGLSGRQATTVNDRIRYRTRDALRAGIASVWPIPADTGTLIGTDEQWINAELVAVNGPWTFQSEYLVNFLQDARVAGPPAGPIVDNLTYHGGYVQLLYYLTGEHDHYSRKTGVFERVIPRENFFRVCTDRGLQTGLGAWQLGVRYNYLDLNDGGINGGLLHNGTAGLNWFLNPNLKVQFNYIATHRDAPLAGDAGEGWIHGWGIRVATDF